MCSPGALLTGDDFREDGDDVRSLPGLGNPQRTLHARRRRARVAVSWAATGDPSRRTHHPTRRGCPSCAAPDDSFTPDSPSATTCRGCRLCATPGAPSIQDGDVSGPPSVHGPRCTLHRQVLRQHHHAGTLRHASFDLVQSSVPPPPTYNIGGARVRLCHIADLLAPSHRSMEAPWTGRDLSTRIV